MLDVDENLNDFDHEEVCDVDFEVCDVDFVNNDSVRDGSLSECESIFSYV